MSAFAWALGSSFESGISAAASSIGVGWSSADSALGFSTLASTCFGAGEVFSTTDSFLAGAGFALLIASSDFALYGIFSLIPSNSGSDAPPLTFDISEVVV